MLFERLAERRERHKNDVFLPLLHRPHLFRLGQLELPQSEIELGWLSCLPKLTTETARDPSVKSIVGIGVDDPRNTVLNNYGCTPPWSGSGLLPPQRGTRQPAVASLWRSYFGLAGFVSKS